MFYETSRSDARPGQSYPLTTAPCKLNQFLTHDKTAVTVYDLFNNGGVSDPADPFNYGVWVLGILPAMMLIKARKAFKPGLALGLGIMLFFVVTMGMELLQETSRLEIKPHMEHWTSTFGLTQK